MACAAPKANTLTPTGLWEIYTLHFSDNNLQEMVCGFSVLHQKRCFELMLYLYSASRNTFLKYGTEKNSNHNKKGTHISCTTHKFSVENKPK
jgi:hypothetical protein